MSEANSPSRYEEDTRSMMFELKKEFKEDMSYVVKKLDNVMENLANRLPVWATLYISLLSALVGGLLIAFASKFIN